MSGEVKWAALYVLAGLLWGANAWKQQEVLELARWDLDTCERGQRLRFTRESAMTCYALDGGCSTASAPR